jgi:hypothetical protein
MAMASFLKSLGYSITNGADHTIGPEPFAPFGNPFAPNGRRSGKAVDISQKGAMMWT